MNPKQFLAEIRALHRRGIVTEHTYRPALEKFFNDLSENVCAINEPARVDVGAPEFVFLRGDIPIGHCEAKDIGTDLKVLKGYSKEQQKRYVEGFQNIIYTNCLDWHFYREGEFIGDVTIADYFEDIKPHPERFATLEEMLHDFITQSPQTITSSSHLAKRMAGKATLIKDVLARSLSQDKEKQTELMAQYHAFKEHLIHDIEPEEFADIYAETITYGMFAARLRDDTMEDFSRHEALDLLPKSNPFLRNLFSYIAGPNLDERISWIIDNLAKELQAADVRMIMEGFRATTQRDDPFLHFYEDFLAAYNLKKKKVRGVWYTPESVVDFIIRAVDDVLKTEFGITNGLADNRKITISQDTGQVDKTGKPLKAKREVHKVQILDPAAGTGTFLAQAIKHIATPIRKTAPGIWAQYVEQDLIPRLHGFELLMASYAMCHIKLEMILREYGYKPTANPPRVSVYLTNSLEEGDAANQSLPFARWLSNEVKEANAVKRDMPIMCVVGNPPYRGESINKGDWIMGLMEAYKKEPGGYEKLRERNSKWINDDYVKFIRLAEHMLEKNGEGVLGFITNHGYLGNPTFRGMRWHLLKTFDKIYVLDLHGNARKRERTPKGKPDKNVFDIEQGVAIVVAVKRASFQEKELARVFHAELWGEREEKYNALWDSSLSSLNWTELENRAPRYYFIQRDNALEEVYQKGFAIQEFMRIYSAGIVTARDALTIDKNKETLLRRISDFATETDPEVLRSKYRLGGDVRDWTVAGAMTDVKENFAPEKVIPIAYRPFDHRWTFYTGISRGFHCMPRGKVMQHFLKGENFGLEAVSKPGKNIGLLVPKFIRDSKFAHTFITEHISEVIFLSGTTGSNAMNFPLYIYPDSDELDQSRRVNFDEILYAKLRKLAAHPQRGEPDEVAVFDYIYAVLYCPAYRETYDEFLKTDFPRIPYPANPEAFWSMAEKGEQLRRLHLMAEDAIGDIPYPFKGEGNNKIEKPKYEGGKVWVNKTQYFADVPEVAWRFPIGGYQPAQKWLKDRKGECLRYEDVTHYQKIIKILSETDRIMTTIEMEI